MFEPVELLERLAVLTPRPRIHLILYHGVLAPRAAWRSLVVSRTEAAGPGGNETKVTHTSPDVPDGTGAPSCRAGSPRWADLMRRTFGFDVLACPNCGGRLRLIALIEEASVMRRILRHLGLPTEIPEPRPARAPRLPFESHPRPADNDVVAFDPC